MRRRLRGGLLRGVGMNGQCSDGDAVGPIFGVHGAVPLFARRVPRRFLRSYSLRLAAPWRCAVNSVVDQRLSGSQ